MNTAVCWHTTEKTHMHHFPALTLTLHGICMRQDHTHLHGRAYIAILMVPRYADNQSLEVYSEKDQKALMYMYNPR